MKQTKDPLMRVKLGALAPGTHLFTPCPHSALSKPLSPIDIE